MAIDSFSKFVIAKALPDQTSDTLAMFLHNSIICEYGVPRMICCDNGREFASRFDEVLKLHKIYRMPACSYYLPALGQVEIINRGLKSVLRREIFHNPGLFWDEALPDITFGFRAAVHSAHGYTPFELLFK